MEKTVTKAEVERVLEQYLTPITKEPIINELFPSFKVGEYLALKDGHELTHSKAGDVCRLALLKDGFCSVEWVTETKQSNGDYFTSRFRHATPEEIAAAEWESGKPYRVWLCGGWMVRISTDRVGCFYNNGSFTGASTKYNKYEKL